MHTDSPKRYHDILRRIEVRLQTASPEEAKELKEIKAKLQIMGPMFIDEANVDRLQAMFDKTSH